MFEKCFLGETRPGVEGDLDIKVELGAGSLLSLDRPIELFEIAEAGGVIVVVRQVDAREREALVVARGHAVTIFGAVERPVHLPRRIVPRHPRHSLP